MNQASQFLNQRAIDGLIASGGNTAAAGAADEARPYSFVRPARIGVATLRRLELINTNAAQGLRRHFGQQFRTSVEVDVMATESLQFSEFACSLGVPSATFLFRVGAGGEALGLLDISSELALSIIDRLLGGTGAGTAPEPRVLTTIEQEMVGLVAQRTLPILKEAWKLLPMGTEITGFESRLPGSDLVDSQEKYLATLFEVRAEGIQGFLTVGLPGVCTEPALDGLHRSRRTPPADLLMAGNPILDETELRQSSLMLTARWPSVLLTLQEIKRLAPGQLIDTTCPLDTPVQLLINGRRLMAGAVGETRGHVAIRVVAGKLKPLPDRLAYTNRGRILMTTDPTTMTGAEAEGAGRATPFPLDALLDVPMPVIIEVGRTHMPLSDVLELQAGSVVSLDRLIGDPVDILVSDRKLAEGEVVVIGEHLGVRITRVMNESGGAGAVA